MRETRVWHGTKGEWSDLNRAVANNCTCRGWPYYLDPTCTAHQLLDEQRSLDRLLFERRIANRLLHEEFSQSPIGAVQ
jgi:hypothetical protein